MAHRRRFLAVVHAVATPSTVFVVLAAIVVVLFVSLAPEVVPPKGGAELPADETRKQALDITLEMNKLVISLATLIFAAVGALVVSKDEVRRLSRGESFLAMLTFLFASAALYFSYLVYNVLVTMLGNSFLEFGDKALFVSRLLQINSLGLAVVTLAALFLAMTARVPKGGSNDASTAVAVAVSRGSEGAGAAGSAEK